MATTVKLRPGKEIAAQLGIAPGGHVQKFYAQRVAAHMRHYLPFRASNSFGAALDRGIAPDGRSITIDLPYARYLYRGKLMVGERTRSSWARADEKKVLAIPEKNLQYTKTHNARAGPYWDRQLIQNDMPSIISELQAYMKGKGNG